MSTRIIMRNDGRATAEGETEVFGTTGAQTVTVLDGATVTFRSGFNNGGDTIRLNGRASDFTVSISGSNVTLRSVVDNITVVIPIGSTANTVTFDNGDSRSLSLVNGVPTLGAQTIPNTGPGEAVTAGPGTFTITGAASANEGGVLTYTVTRTGTASAETLLFSVDGSTNGGVVASATQGADFSPASGAIVFAAGQATATFTVAVAADSAVEGLEGISVRVIKDGSVVASTNATIIDGNTQGQALTVTPGVDNVVGTAGNDSITGRISEFSSLDTVTGGAGIDTLVLTGALPTDTQLQPAAVLDGAFQGTTGVERLVLTGGTLAQSVNATLGTLARAAGLTEVVAGGTGAQAQVIDIEDFDAALTVTGSANAEVVNVDLGTAGAKTLNLGAGADVVNVTPVSGTAGSVQVNFTSASVGNGTDNTVTIVSANGNVTVNDESTSIVSSNLSNNVFNVVGLAADGTVDPTQNRGNFARVELGSSAADVVTTGAFIPANPGFFGIGATPAVPNPGNVYFNLGAGNDTVTAIAEAGERHFVVGGIGEDELTASTEAASSRIVALMGADDDTVVVGTNLGAVDINLGDGDDFIQFTSEFVTNGVDPNTVDDVVAGGAGRDTLAALSSQLTAIDNTQTIPGNPVLTARQSVTGFEALVVSNTLGANLTTSLIQAGIDTVTLGGGTNGSTVTFDAGLASTLNLGVAVNNTIRVASAGAGTADQVTIANTALPQGNGVATNAFNGQAITTTGVETLIINTTAAGSANIQTIGGISATTGTIGTVNFVGDDGANAGIVAARNVNASGLTGAGITATTIGTNPATGTNTFTGSAARDVVTLGAGRQALNLGDGNDTLIITASNDLAAGTSVLAGGAGTDTIQTTSAIAAGLSISNPFNANQSGFEVLSISQATAAPGSAPLVDTIRVDNLNVNRVISSGTANGSAGLGNFESFTFTAVALSQGQSLTFTDAASGAPVTFTASTALTAEQVATGVVNLINGAVGVLLPYLATANGAVVTANATFGANDLVDRPDIAIAINNAATLLQPTVAETTPGVAPVAAVREVATLTLPVGIVPAAGDTFQLDDVAGVPTDFVPFTFTSNGNQTGQALANNIAAQINAANGPNQIGSQYVASVVDGGNGIWRVVITANVGVDRTDISLQNIDPDFNGATNLSIATTTPGANAIAAVNEVQTVTFAGLLQGQSVTVAGRTVTATTQALTAEQVSDAFESGVNGLTIISDPTLGGNGSRVSGTLTGFTEADSLGDATTVLTATSAGDVGNASAVANLAPLATAPVPTITQGQAPGVLGAAGTIILQNMSSGDTLELTGPAGIGSTNGVHDVRLIDAGLNTNDVLNVVLTNNTNAARDFGTVITGNVETVNLNLNDTGLNANTAATIEIINLNIVQTTSLVVSGNNGANIAQNAAGLTLFDASGIVGNAGDLRADLGVFFTSQNANSLASVTIRGGIGNDDLVGNAANDTFDLTRGGSDLVGLGSTRANNGLDTINGFTGGTGAGGDVLDLNRAAGAAGDVIGVDSNGGTLANGIIFNATASNTVGDRLIENGVGGQNTSVYFVTDGNALLNVANVKGAIDGPTAQNGEILVTNGSSAYVLHASSAGSNTFNVYRVFDADAGAGIVAQVELMATVNMTNTFGDLTLDNVNQVFTANGSLAPLAAADIPVAPAGGSMVGMLDNLGSFQIV